MTDRAFNWTMGSVCGVVVILFVTMTTVVILGAPERRARYMADCEGRGFSAPQCALLYRQKQDVEAAELLAISATLTAAAAAARR